MLSIMYADLLLLHAKFITREMSSVQSTISLIEVQKKTLTGYAISFLRLLVTASPAYSRFFSSAWNYMCGNDTTLLRELVGNLIKGTFLDDPLLENNSHSINTSSDVLLISYDLSYCCFDGFIK